MRTQLMRHFAVVLGFSLCSIATPDCSATAQGYAGEDTYQAPARWNNFQRPSALIRSATVNTKTAQRSDATIQRIATQQGIEALPTPDAESIPPIPRKKTTPGNLGRPTPAPIPASPPPGSAALAQDNTAPDNTAPGNTGQNITAQGNNDFYAATDASSWDGGDCQTCQAAAVVGPKPIARWFGGASLLFWNVGGCNDTPVITNDSADVLLGNSDLDPSSAVGYDIHFGRYLSCGKYGLDFGYLFWDPDSVSHIVADNGTGLRFIAPALTTVSVNRGGGATSVYDDFDTNAVRIRATRDIRIQGFEVNLNCFGLSGARRLGSCSPSALCANPLCRSGHCGRKFYGGLTGPLARACSGCIRIQTSHGLRWFQLEDELQIAGNVDGNAGYGADDLYYDIETENNLFGYQFGGTIAYCLGCRTMLTIGGKMGVYGNDAEFTQRIGTNSILAYTNSQGSGAGDVSTRQSHVCVAGLGELDFGLGYRLSNRWTVNGGYRILAVTGVATSIGQRPGEYTTVASAGAVRADDSLFLHGAYVGIDYNW